MYVVVAKYSASANRAGTTTIFRNSVRPDMFGGWGSYCGACCWVFMLGLGAIHICGLMGQVRGVGKPSEGLRYILCRGKSHSAGHSFRLRTWTLGGIALGMQCCHIFAGAHRINTLL